jgi:hypothetical protein
MPIWQRKLFGALSRNMSYAPDYFFIPCTQIVQFIWMLKAEEARWRMNQKKGKSDPEPRALPSGLRSLASPSGC